MFSALISLRRFRLTRFLKRVYDSRDQETLFRTQFTTKKKTNVPLATTYNKSRILRMRVRFREARRPSTTTTLERNLAHMMKIASNR